MDTRILRCLLSAILLLLGLVITAGPVQALGSVPASTSPPSPPPSLTPEPSAADRSGATGPAAPPEKPRPTVKDPALTKDRPQPPSAHQPTGAPVQYQQPPTEETTRGRSMLASTQESVSPTTGSISGRVTASDSGEPLGGACVTASAYLTMASSTGCTDTGGGYTIVGLGPGDYLLEARDVPQSHVTQLDTARVHAGQTATVDFALDPGGAISGTVTDAETGAPLAGICVTAYGEDAHGGGCTDASGHYKTEGLYEGSWYLMFDATGPGAGPYISSEVDSTVVSVGVTTVRDTTMTRGARISGVITGAASGSPVAGACVYPVDPDTGFYGAQTCADSSGRYQTVGLEAGTYILYLFDPSGAHLQGESEPISVGHHEAKVADLTLELGGSLHGRVTDVGNGQPVANVCPAAYGTGAAVARCSDSSGAWSLVGLDTGSVKVSFYDSDARYVEIWYRDQPTREAATAIAVQRGESITGLDQPLTLGGSVAGTITDRSTGQPVRNAAVRVHTSAGATLSGGTDATGRYAVGALPAGAHKVEFSHMDYVGEWWNDKPSKAAADAVDVVLGATTAAVDAAMVAKGRISGRVTDASTGQPLAGVSVNLSSTTCCSYGYAVTAADGTYTSTSLVAGTYRISFYEYDEGYLPQYYNGTSDYGSAAPVSVGDGEEVQGIDAAMVLGGRIEGTVTSQQTGAPLSGVDVGARTAAGQWVGRCSSCTDPSGRYSLRGLPTGEYAVEFSPRFGVNLLTEYFRDQTSAATANLVSVTEGLTTSGIDEDLAAGGAIAGRVTDLASGQPLHGAWVEVLTSDGEAVPGKGTYSDAAGDYTVPGLRAGSYVLRFARYSYKTVYYSGALTVGAATPVAVNVPATTSGIDQAMTTGGTVSGTITDAATGQPLQAACAAVFQATDTRYAVASACTDAEGHYKATGLATGNYVLRASPPAEDPHLVTWYGGTSAASATILPVHQDGDVTGVNLQMRKGGQIEGTITSTTTGQPIAGVCVTIEYPDCQAFTDNQGRYLTHGLATGTSWASFRAGGYVTSWSQPVSVNEGTTARLDASMNPAATIAGSVTDSTTGGPVLNARVVARPTNDVYAAYVGWSGTGGDYTVTGLPAGTYTVSYEANGHLPQWFDHKANAVDATPISLLWGQTAMADAALVPSEVGTLSGTVRDQATGSPLQGASVCSLNGSRACTSTAADGTYSLTVTAGANQIRVNASGYVESPTRSLTVPVGGQVLHDEALEQGGQINAEVTDAGNGAPLAGICLDFTRITDGYSYVTCNGRNFYYPLLSPPLPAGQYKLRFTNPYGRYIPEWFLHKPDQASADVVTITKGQVAQASTTLTLGGSVSGTVTDAVSGQPLQNVCIAAFSSGGTQIGSGGCTGADGRYQSPGLPAGSAFLEFTSSSGQHLTRFWKGSSTLASADPVQVSVGQDTPNIDIALPSVFGTLRGRATDANGQPIPGACAAAYSVGSSTPAGSSCSGDDGRWELRGLAAGTFEVAVSDPSGARRTTWLESSASRAGARPVTVEQGEILTGLDTVLPDIVRRAVADFDGDGSTDRSVYREGVWYADGQGMAYFGLAGDRPVPGDYDGDGDIERAVYRGGAWYVEGQATVYFGLADDIPVPGDYDGDGDTDRAVFRPSVGGWYVDGQPTVYLGWSGDVPVPGDYDGDGDIERAVYRDGAWYVESHATVYLGLAGDIPVTADYDGDGAADRAVFRPSVGAWYVDGQPTVYLGWSGDVPVPGDYDGDGDSERAIYRDGGWYVDGQTPEFFGLSRDIPLPIPPAIYGHFFSSASAGG